METSEQMRKRLRFDMKHLAEEVASAAAEVARCEAQLDRARHGLSAKQAKLSDAIGRLIAEVSDTDIAELLDA